MKKRSTATPAALSGAPSMVGSPSGKAAGEGGADGGGAGEGGLSGPFLICTPKLIVALDIAQALQELHFGAAVLMRRSVDEALAAAGDDVAAVIVDVGLLALSAAVPPASTPASTDGAHLDASTGACTGTSIEAFSAGAHPPDGDQLARLRRLGAPIVLIGGDEALAEPGAGVLPVPFTSEALARVLGGLRLASHEACTVAGICRQESRPFS